MSQALTSTQPPVTVSTVPTRKVTSLRESLSQARTKIHEDISRFRTCCADPRASK